MPKILGDEVMQVCSIKQWSMVGQLWLKNKFSDVRPVTPEPLTKKFRDC